MVYIENVLIVTFKCKMGHSDVFGRSDVPAYFLLRVLNAGKLIL